METTTTTTTMPQSIVPTQIVEHFIHSWEQCFKHFVCIHFNRTYKIMVDHLSYGRGQWHNQGGRAGFQTPRFNWKFCHNWSPNNWLQWLIMSVITSSACKASFLSKVPRGHHRYEACLGSPSNTCTGACLGGVHWSLQRIPKAIAFSNPVREHWILVSRVCRIGFWRDLLGLVDNAGRSLQVNE